MKEATAGVYVDDMAFDEVKVKNFIIALDARHRRDRQHMKETNPWPVLPMPL
jgi:hypothetical protein